MKTIYYASKIIIQNFYTSVIITPLSAVYALLNFRKKGTHYIVLTDHIGDSIIALGFLQAYQKRYHADRIVIVCCQGWEKILRFYPNEFDRVLLLPKHRLHQIMTLGSTNFGQHVLGKMSHVKIINPSNDFTCSQFNYIIRFPQITLNDCIKYGILHLSETEKFIPPQFKTMKSTYNRRTSATGNRVIISPYAAFTSMDPVFFKQLAEHLAAEGFDVYTNVSGTELPLKGTKELRVDLNDLITIAETACGVIGLRSGLFDLLMYTDCCLLAVYPQATEYKQFFTLQMLEQTRAQAEEMELSGDFARDNIQILNWLKKKKHKTNK